MAAIVKSIGNFYVPRAYICRLFAHFFDLFERKAYALLFDVNAYYNSPYLLADFEHVGRVLYIAVGNL